MYIKIKFVIDFIIALIAMPFTGLIILISAICIKLDDSGPVFYMADRTGRFGKPFKMFKLRTMKVNAPDIRLDDDSTYNSEDDPRVTAFGRIARKTSIDELPQLINVLKGEMAIIGPRPDSVSYIGKYTDEERQILNVRPGITGYNQAINRNAAGTKEKLRNDIYYVNHMSFLFDVKILFMTVKTVFLRKNIYRKTEQTAEHIEEMSEVGKKELSAK